MHAHTEQIAMHELWAIHTYDVDSIVQPNETILNGLRNICARARALGSHNSAVFGAKPPGCHLLI